MCDPSVETESPISPTGSCLLLLFLPLKHRSLRPYETAYGVTLQDPKLESWLNQRTGTKGRLWALLQAEVVFGIGFWGVRAFRIWGHEVVSGC